MLRKAIELIRRAGLRAYHGSDEPDIEELAAYKPNLQYGGDIGAGVYVSENYDTAASYGRYVYVLDLALDWGDIFDLSAENQYIVEGYEGESVLVGEFVPPFYFLVGDKKYLVSNTDYDIGAALRAKEMLIESLESAGLDILVSLVREHDGLPSIDDIEWHLDDVAESEEAQAAIMQQVAPMVSAAEAWFETNEAAVVDLDEIGGVAEEAGYKALYFERGGTVGDEILVFDPANVRIVEKATKTAKMRITADEDSEHIDEGISDMAEMVAERPVRDEHEIASETVAITLIPAVGPEDWDLHVLEGTDIGSGLLPSGRIVIGDIGHPDAVLSWSTQYNKPFVHNVWVAEDLRKHGVARILYDAFRRHVNDHVVSVGPWSPGGYETSKALSDEVLLEPPEQWKAKKAAGWRNELTRQDVAGIYELTYKYQMLKQEAALGDYGVPTILPDAAYMEFEKIKGELSQKLEDAHDVFVRAYDSWIEHHQPGAEEDLSTSIYEHVMHELSLASDYPDLLNVFSEEELREVLAEEVKKHISWASKYEELPQDGTDYATLDPDSMTFAELTALPFTGEGTNRWRPTPGDTLLRPYQRSGFFNDLVSALESHPAIDDIVNDRMEVERDEFYSARQLTGVMAMLEALNDEWEKLPEGLDKDIELFQEALNVAHNNGSMAEYILEVGGQGPDRGAGEFLSDLSENPDLAVEAGTSSACEGAGAAERVPNKKDAGRIHRNARAMES